MEQLIAHILGWIFVGFSGTRSLATGKTDSHIVNALWMIFGALLLNV